MANEANIRAALSIRKRSGSLTLIDYSRSASFRADVDGTKGPCVGTVAVSTDGVALDFSQLIQPGWCWLHNESAEFHVAIGPRDPDSALFYPMIELLPGERYPIRLSRDLFEEYQATGTGTGSPTNTLWAKAFGGSVNLLVEAFEA